MGIKHTSSRSNQGPQAGPVRTAPPPLRAAALALAIAAALAALPRAQAAPVATLAAAPAGSTAQRLLEGSIQPVRQATLAAQVGGAVLALNVKAGDRVRAGQPIARIDERETQAGLQRGEAGVAQAEAEWRNAQANAQRSRELKAQGFVSQAALDQAETQLKAAQAALQGAQAARSQAALARGNAAVTAPFDAVVLATHLEAGDLASPGRAIATVYSPDALRAVVQVPLSQAASARAASGVQVLLADGRVLTPTAQAVLPTADAVSQTVEWRLELPAQPAGAAPLLPGQAVRVQWAAAAAAPVAASAPVGPVVVPPGALLRRGELTAVYVVQGERFVLRAVRAGAERGSAGTEVLAGLKPGERIARDAVAAGLAGATPEAPR